MAEFFEVMMLLCFGLSWPANIMKSLRSRTAKGKSLMFEALVVIGYLCGLAGKFISGNVTYVVAVYILDMFTNGLVTQLLYFNFSDILSGQIWRLFTFVLVPAIGGAGTAGPLQLSFFFMFLLSGFSSKDF